MPSLPLYQPEHEAPPAVPARGFDSVEIAIENLAHLDPALVKAEVDRHGLACGSVTPCLGPDKDSRGTAVEQRAGMEFIKRLLIPPSKLPVSL